MVTRFQLIAILFAFFMMYFTVRSYRRKRFDMRASALWFILWTGLVIGVLLFQTISDYALTYLGVLAEDLFVFLAIFILFGLCFNFFSKFQETKKQLNEITYEIALRDAKKGSKK